MVCNMRLEELLKAARDGADLDVDWKCRTCGLYAGSHTSATIQAAGGGSADLTGCPLTLAHLGMAERVKALTNDGPILDREWRCRVCGNFRGRHTRQNRVMATEANQQARRDLAKKKNSLIAKAARKKRVLSVSDGEFDIIS